MTTNKKELKEKYKQYKPEMGVFMLKHLTSNKCYLVASSDLKSMINRTKFQLKQNAHMNKLLQKQWLADGESAFKWEIVDKLDYSKDEDKTDYTDDLKELAALWQEKLLSEADISFY